MKRKLMVLLAGTLIFVGLMNWAITFLGRHFSVQVTIQKDHELVTNGPYRWVRHPRYLGIVVCFVGISLGFASVGALTVAGLLLLTILWRIADEEALMAGSFPAEWRAYVRTSWRLIPWVY
jgi:protein-S-isoprenylcysteine O-methyltransferase